MHDASSLTEWLSTLDGPRTAALIASALAAHAALALALGALTRRPRERARAAAAEWARARASRAEARARERATPEARTERAARRGALARALLVGVIAVAATNLSAHGIQAGLAGIGLGAVDTRISAFIVFEGLLALSAGLSWWHQTTNQPGSDRYRAAMWTITAVMSYLGWAWSGTWVFAIWPPLAAVAWHWVVTAEARRRHGRHGLVSRARAQITAHLERRFRPTGEADRRRHLTRLERRTVRANTAPRAWRWAWVRAWARANEAAEARGLLDEDTRVAMAARIAARYAGPAALAPEAVAGLDPWARATVARQDAPAAPEAPPALRVVQTSAPAREIATEAADSVRAMLQARFTGPADPAQRETVIDYLADHWETHRAWPTGRALAETAGAHPGTGRKWLASIRDHAA